MKEKIKQPLTEGKMKSNIKDVKPGEKPRNPPPPHPRHFKCECGREL